MLEELRVADYALDGRTQVVEAEGPVDIYSAPLLEELTSRAIRDGKTHVIVDLSRVTLIDSTGLSVLVGALRRLRRARGTVELVITDYDIERLFEMTGLDGVFRIHRTRDEAVEELGRSRHG